VQSSDARGVRCSGSIVAKVQMEREFAAILRLGTAPRLNQNATEIMENVSLPIPRLIAIMIALIVSHCVELIRAPPRHRDIHNRAATQKQQREYRPSLPSPRAMFGRPWARLRHGVILLSSIPRQLAASPRLLATSPRQLAIGPRQLATSPRQLTTSPLQLSSSPRQLAISPREES
jgi:hypothetical protein